MHADRRVDYDAIAHLYDETRRDHDVDLHLLKYLDTQRQQPNTTAVRALDVGCGTGKQLAANRTRCPVATMLGVDRSSGMLEVAKTRCPDVHWIQGDGAALPLATESVHYATSQFSYPHIRQPGPFVAEMFRVLKPLGQLVITNIDPWSMPGWLYYRYFPAVQALDFEDFVPVDTLSDLLRDAGFADIRVERQDRSLEVALSDFLTEATQRHRASQLMAIPDADYEKGLQRLRHDIRNKGEQHSVVSDLVLVAIVCDKPV